MHHLIFQIRGYSLTELTIGVALSSVVAVTAGRAIQPVISSTVSLSTRETIDAPLAHMGQLIKSIGRVAKSCSKDTATGALVCVLSPATPHNGTNQDMRVQFIRTTDGLEFQKEFNAGVWTRQMIAKGVYDFILCDATDMRLSQCTITPSNLSASFAAFAAAPQNFFRFHAIARQEQPNGKVIQVEYQSSFSVRNSGSVRYEGG